MTLILSLCSRKNILPLEALKMNTLLPYLGPAIPTNRVVQTRIRARQETTESLDRRQATI
jgi:hypothetical protein